MESNLVPSRQDDLKRQVARAALDLIAPRLTPGCVVGVGTGSTANFFIDALAAVKDSFGAAVSSSEATTRRLAARGIRVADLNAVDRVVAYVDGADEVEPGRAALKGGGGALTREKIVAASAERFVCIVDESKLVERLGSFPLPVEVIPLAEKLVARRLAALGGDATPRTGFLTDNGNRILDARGFAIDDPVALEAALNNIPGVVENGLFAGETRPHTVLVGARGGARVLGG